MPKIETGLKQVKQLYPRLKPAASFKKSIAGVDNALQSVLSKHKGDIGTIDTRSLHRALIKALMWGLNQAKAGKAPAGIEEDRRLGVASPNITYSNRASSVHVGLGQNGFRPDVRVSIASRPQLIATEGLTRNYREVTVATHETGTEQLSLILQELSRPLTQEPKLLAHPKNGVPWVELDLKDLHSGKKATKKAMKRR